MQIIIVKQFNQVKRGLLVQKINIKPLSVNDAWQGKRFKTPEYKKFERDVILMLSRQNIPSGELSLAFEFGFSSVLSDYDNPIKPVQDIISGYYGFNDNRIYHGEQLKRIVKKGEEYIKFSINKLDENKKIII